MYKSRINELVETIPLKSKIYAESKPIPGGVTPCVPGEVTIHRRAHALLDPQFPWKYAQAFAHLKLPLPALEYESFIKQAYDHLWGRKIDEEINAALIIQQPNWQTKRGFLEALLLLPDLRLDEVAKWTGFSVSTVMVYEQLFFNVRDRLNDEIYVNEICYPNTRQVEYRIDYWDTVGPRELMLRAAFNKDLDAVLQIFGTRIPREEKSAEITAKKVKASIMADADFVVRAGGSSSKVAVLEAAHKIIVATEKRVPSMQGLGDDVIGLTAIGLTPGQSILKTALGMMDHTEYEKRLALQEAELGNK